MNNSQAVQIVAQLKIFLNNKDVIIKKYNYIMFYKEIVM